MAIYYVSTDGSATSPYDTPAKAAASVNAVLDYIATQAPDTNTVHIAAGTYSGAASAWVFDHTAQSNTTIIGAGAAVCVQNMTANARNIYVSAAADNVTIRGVTFRSNQASKQIEYLNGGATGWVTEDCVFESVQGHSQIISLISNHTNFTYRRCVWRSCGGEFSMPPVSVAGASSGKFIFCLSEATGFGTSFYWKIESTGEVKIIGCIIVDSESWAVYGNSASLNLTISGSKLAGGIKGRSADTVYNNNAAGVLNVDHSVIVPNPYNPVDYVVANLDTDASNIKTGQASATSFGRGGYIMFCVDDSNWFSTTQALETVLAQYGFKGSYFLDFADWDSADNAALVAMHNRGVIDIGLHSYSHTNFTFTHGVKITYAGADTSPTVTFDGSVIRLRTSEGNDDVNIGPIPSDYTIGELVRTTNNWTLAKSDTDGQAATEIHDACLVSSLALIPLGTPTVVPGDMDFDRTGITQGFYKNEIADPKAALEAILGSDIYSWGFPYNDSDDDAVAALIDAGFTSGRAATYSAQTSIDLYRIYSYPLPAKLIVSGNEEQTRIGARALAFAAAQSGLVVAILLHDLSAFTIDEVTWVIDELSKCDGITVTSAKEIAEAVRANSVDAGGGIFTRNFAAFTDWKAQTADVEINTGPMAMSVELTGEQADGVGNTVTLPGLYNINVGIDQTKFYTPAILGGSILGGKFL